MNPSGTHTRLGIAIANVAILAGVFLGGNTVHAEGLTAAGSQIFQQAGPITGASEAGDHFGESLASGDFNGDGFDDLAIGIPDEDVNGIVDAGGVVVLYGDSSGLFGTTFDQFWWVASMGEAGVTGGRFGVTVATGDINGDGYDDLVVAEKDAPDAEDADGIWAILGSASGLVSTGSFHTAYQNDQVQFFGFSTYNALAVGDFNGDQFADIAYSGVSVDLAGPSFSGWLLLFGSATSVGGQWEVEAGVTSGAGFNEPNSLAVGQFDADATDEIVAGNVDRGTGGEVLLCLDSDCTTQEIWSQSSGGISGVSEAGDDFGASLAVGDFNDDGNDDVAIGSPGEDSSFTDQGAIRVIYGDGSGLTSAGNLFLQAGAFTALDAAYGTTVAAGNFDAADAADQLAGGQPFHHAQNIIEAGSVYTHFTSATTRSWHQDVLDIQGENSLFDHQALALTTGDFNGDGADDLAVGVPDEDISGAADAGAVNIYYGTPVPEPGQVETLVAGAALLHWLARRRARIGS